MCQADDLFVYFGAKPKKDLSSRSRRDRKWAKERRSERSWKKELKEGVGEGWCRGTVDTGQQKRLAGMRQSPGAVREDQSRWISIPRGFVEISRRMHVSVSLQMHRECSVTEPPFLHLSWPKLILIVCSLFFFSHSLGCISCSYKEIFDTPTGTTRWIIGQVRIVSKKLISTRGREGYCDNLSLL